MYEITDCKTRATVEDFRRAGTKLLDRFQIKIEDIVKSGKLYNIIEETDMNDMEDTLGELLRLGYTLQGDIVINVSNQKHETSFSGALKSTEANGWRYTQVVTRDPSLIFDDNLVHIPISSKNKTYEGHMRVERLLTK